MAREASTRPSPLGASRERNHYNSQRNREEALHKNILRLFAKCELAILAAVFLRLSTTVVNRRWRREQGVSIP
jgi:hypothetical protein